MWDHQSPSHRGDDAGDAAFVGSESRRGLSSSWPSMEVGDLFLPLCHEGALLGGASLGESHVVGVLGGVTVDGGNESIRGGPDYGFEVLIVS